MLKQKQGGALTIVIITIAVIAFIALMIGGFIASNYNGLVQLDTNTQQKWGNVQTAYERRAGLIPNLVATVKGSAGFEKETQTQIASLRSGIKNAQTPADLNRVGSQMNSMIGSLIVQVEAYPTLASTENFRALQDSLEGTENRIKWERDNYNIAVKDYSNGVRSFPSNVIAGMFGFELSKWKTFEAEDNASVAPSVNFS